jgi:hypothetical protein
MVGALIAELASTSDLGTIVSVLPSATAVTSSGDAWFLRA